MKIPHLHLFTTLRRGGKGEGLIIEFIERDGELHWSGCGSFSVGSLDYRGEEITGSAALSGKIGEISWFRSTNRKIGQNCRTESELRAFLSRLGGAAGCTLWEDWGVSNSLNKLGPSQVRISSNYIPNVICQSAGSLEFILLHLRHFMWENYICRFINIHKLLQDIALRCEIFPCYY